MGSIGPGEILIIGLIALLLFGAGRVADIGKGLGQGIRNFKEGLRDLGDSKPSEEKAAPAPPEKTAPALLGVGDRSQESHAAVASRAKQNVD